MKRKFHVTLLEHDEGVSVSCPELPGCHSQGANVDEALENIEGAIRGYIDLYGEPETRCEIREMEVVTALLMPKLPGVNHLRVIKALEKGRRGDRVIR